MLLFCYLISVSCPMKDVAQLFRMSRDPSCDDLGTLANDAGH